MSFAWEAVDSFINLARGQVVDIKALKKNIESGKIRGSAIDVFPLEPKNNQEHHRRDEYPGNQCQFDARTHVAVP